MSKQEINKGFIDYLRLNFGTTNWIFDNTEQTEIVPKELTHDYLLSNFNIDDSIYKYYHLPNSNLLSDSEFQKMKDTGFVGDKETALRPYSNIVYGAYYSRSDLACKLSGIAFGSKPKTIEGTEIKFFNDLIPYFKEYAKGFENGFNEFDNTQIKPFLTMLAEKQDYVNKVFEYITKKLFFIHDWANLRTGFTTNQNNEIVKAFENGKQQGYFYRAWSTVFSNNNLFAPLFQKYFNMLPPQPISVYESRTKKVIFETITNIDKQGWQYAFVSEEDYILFTNLLTNFFEYKSYTLPETIIQLKRTCKTKVAKALGEIHKELSENKLSTDTKYFQLIRVLSHFEKETEGDLYKALTR